VYASGALAATGSSVQVAYDAHSKESVELPEEYRERLREFEDLE